MGAGEGVPGNGPSLRDTVWGAAVGDGSLASIRRIVHGGAPASAAYRTPMPAFGGQLLAEDIERVAAYVFTLSRPGRAVADVPTRSDSAQPDGATNAEGSTGSRRP